MSLYPIIKPMIIVWDNNIMQKWLLISLVILGACYKERPKPILHKEIVREKVGHIGYNFNEEIWVIVSNNRNLCYTNRAYYYSAVVGDSLNCEWYTPVPDR